MELIINDLVALDLQSASSDEVIKSLTELMEKSGYVSDSTQYIKDVLEREKEVDTAVGFGVAVPHAKSTGVKKACVSFARLQKPIKWGKDKVNINMIFQIAVPQDKNNLHLDILAQLFKKLVNKNFRSALLSANSADKVCAILNDISK